MLVPDCSALFTPFELRGLTLKNRIVLPAMGRLVCQDGAPTPGVASFLAARAAGGASLVMTEGVYIDAAGSGDDPTLGHFHGEDRLEGWGQVAQAIHAAGGLTMPELWHVGLNMAGCDLVDGEPVYRPASRQLSPSGYLKPGLKVAEPMTQAQIDEVIDAFGRGAQAARRLGFDGVELHGAHGFLIDQFFWAQTNHRTDRYGGSPARRSRFAAEIVAECRRRIGPDMPIVMRLSQWKLVDYQAKFANSPQELEEMLAPLVDAGVDLFDCSERRFWEPAFEDGDLNLAGWAKKLSGKPSMTVGSVGLDSEMRASLMEGRTAAVDLSRLDRLMEMFARGDFDLVGVGRAMLAEPRWPSLVRDMAFDQLTPFSPATLGQVVD